MTLTLQNHVTYKDFLQYLEQFMVPKDQMYQQMAMMQPPRRNDDNIPGTTYYKKPLFNNTHAINAIKMESIE